MLGLHAAAKILRAKGKDGRIRRYSMLIFGLSATGKTTHSCHDHGLNEDGEGIEFVQDDVVFLRKNGAAYGPERGLFIKTDGLGNPDLLPLIYHAATSKNALTRNGRGIVLRDDIPEKYRGNIDLPPLSELDGMIIAFITKEYHYSNSLTINDRAGSSIYAW
jgi:phosphoenolpyruvate carboxykinase (ATP)